MADPLRRLALECVPVFQELKEGVHQQLMRQALVRHPVHGPHSPPSNHSSTTAVSSSSYTRNQNAIILIEPGKCSGTRNLTKLIT